MKNHWPATIYVFLILAIPCQWAWGSEQALHQRLLSVVAESSADAGYSLYVLDDESGYGAVHGNGSPDGKPITQEHLFRIASITKTFVAAAIIRLVEEKRLSLDEPISERIKDETNKKLVEDGYDTQAITVRHLLSHTSGLADHAQTPEYLQRVFSSPHREWTREQQISACMEWSDPVGLPGKQYAYSDTGYLILGEIIELTLNMPLPVAVRGLLKLDEGDYDTLHWEAGDNQVPDQFVRAHQYMEGRDTYTWSPSIDLFGGGGIVASPKDVARFYHQLFSGRVYHSHVNLKTMLSDAMLPEDSPYRLGVFEKDVGGRVFYQHSGFWGTLVIIDPNNKRVMAGAVTRNEDFKKLSELMTEFIAELAGEKSLSIGQK